MASEFAPMDEHRSALILTDDEWHQLRLIADFYLCTGHPTDSGPRIDLCRRIMEVTE